MRFRLVWPGWWFILLAIVVPGQTEDSKDATRLTGLVPLEICPGSEVTLKLRGLKLDAVTDVRFPALAGMKAEVKEKKKADLPTGQEAKEVGDTQCEVVFKLPSDAPLGPLDLEIVSPTGVLTKRVRVIPKETLVEEKEPNNGFREAQPISWGKILRGKIEPEKDVDVFSFNATKGQRVGVDVFASRATSLLDPLVTIYDAGGRALMSVDDSETRDPSFIFQAPADGPYLVAIQDSGDRGGPWHAYELKIEEVAR